MREKISELSFVGEVPMIMCGLTSSRPPSLARTHRTHAPMRTLWFAEMSTLKAIHAAGGHDNIARVLDVFEDPNSYYFVLELVSLSFSAHSFAACQAVLRETARVVGSLDARYDMLARPLVEGACSPSGVNALFRFMKTGSFDSLCLVSFRKVCVARTDTMLP